MPLGDRRVALDDRCVEPARRGRRAWSMYWPITSVCSPRCSSTRRRTTLVFTSDDAASR
nr:hypothetical protein [Angustibacter aerolatus]